MKVKSVVDCYGRSLEVDEESKKLHSYDNEKKKITYTAEIIENGQRSGFWTDYEETGTVDSIRDRLKTWNNAIRLGYASAVGFNASENDPDRKKWEEVVEYVEANQDKFFKKSGNFRKNCLIDPKTVRAIFEK